MATKFSLLVIDMTELVFIATLCGDLGAASGSGFLFARGSQVAVALLAMDYVACATRLKKEFSHDPPVLRKF